MTIGDAAKAILQARRSAGLTQSQLAALAATSQSAVAAYETGAREPSASVLCRLISAAEHRLELTVSPDPVIFRLAELAQQISATGDDKRRLRLVFEFLRAADDEGYALALLVSAAPAMTGDPRYDALLAAIAEDRCIAAGVPAPTWVNDPGRFLGGFWWVSDVPSGRARALVHAPAAYRRRGVMLDRHDLQAA